MKFLSAALVFMISMFISGFFGFEKGYFDAQVIFFGSLIMFACCLILGLTSRH